MKQNKKLFEQAILDAKSIRESALANAKVSLEESLTPKLQKLLAKKLQEQEEKVYESEITDNLDENENLDEELDLDEILAELELEEGGDNSPTLSESHSYPDLDESDEKKDSKPAEPKKDSKPTPAPKADASPTPDFGGEGGEEGISDDDKLNSLTVADLKDIL